MRSVLLPAVMALAALLACGPSGPSDPSPPGGGGSNPGGGGGSNPGGGGGSSPGGGATPGGGQPAWLTVIGGLGSEYLHDVAATPGDAVAALNVIGVNGDRADQLGIHLLVQPDGHEASKRFHDLGGVPVRFAAGSLAASPAGDLYVALTASCDKKACARLGGAPVDGPMLVKLTSAGDVSWARTFRGEVVSNVAAGAAGVVVVTAESGVSVVHRLDPGGALAWEMSVHGGGPSAVALDAGGDVLLGAGDSVRRLGTAGNTVWQASVDSGVEDLAVAPAGAVVYGEGVVTALDAGGARRWTARVDVPRDASPGTRRVAIGADGGVFVMGGAGCGTVLARVGADGRPLGSRPLVHGGCGGDDVSFFGLTATSRGAAVSGAIRGNAVDLGTPHRDVSGPMDGFAEELDE